jgi:glyoxylase-like metal-dependent hydrolase (beta-lactamase superfamily II)
MFEQYSHMPHMVLDRLRSNGIRITSITERLHVIHGRNRSRTPFANVFLILDKKHVLMDSGCGPEIIQTLADEVGIDMVINSHSHLDHTAGNSLLQEVCNSEIMVPLEGSDTISRAELMALRFVSEPLVRIWMETYPPMTGFRDFTINSTYSHGQEISTGTMRFIALHTPGHLGDHYCLWEPDEHILVGFDIDLSPFGPWYGNPECDISLFKRSIDEIRKMPSEIYLSSHARPLKNPYIAKRLNAYSSFFEERDGQILDLLASGQPMNMEALVKLSPFYAADHSQQDMMLWFGEEQMIQKHLEGLMEEGLVMQEGESYRLKRL